MSKEEVKEFLIKNSKTRVLILVGTIAIFVCFGLIKMDYLKSLFIEPVCINAYEEGEIALKNRNKVICHLGDLEIYDTGYYITKTTKTSGYYSTTKKVIESYIYYTYIGDEIVLFKYPCMSVGLSLPDVLSGKKYKGYFTKIAKSGMLPEIIDDWISECQKVGYELNKEEFSDKMFVILAEGEIEGKRNEVKAVVIIIGVFCIFLLHNLLPIINLKTCRGIRRAIKRYGDLDTIYKEIEQGEVLNNIKNVLITDKWLVQADSKDIIKCDDIVWITQNDGFGTWYSMRRTYIYTKNYKKYCIYSSQNNNCLDYYYMIGQSRPWIVIGKSKEMRKQWMCRRFECIQEERV